MAEIELGRKIPCKRIAARNRINLMGMPQDGRTPNRRLVIEASSEGDIGGAMRFLGIDLHTNCFTCCYLEENGQRRTATFKLDTAGINEFRSTLDKSTYVLIEATINTFAFVELFQDAVAETVIANTNKLRIISFTDKKTDRVDAEKLARIIKTQVLSGEEQVHPVPIPPNVVQDLRALFTTYRLLTKEITITKNRIHSLLKQNLFQISREQVFNKKNRGAIRKISSDSTLSFQFNLLFDCLEKLEEAMVKLTEHILVAAAPFIHEIDILTSKKGVSVMAAAAIMSDIISIDRFPDSKHFASYLRTAPRVESSNEKTVIKRTNKAGRKMAMVFLSQSAHHCRDADPNLARWYERLTEYKKKGLVRMALCRRVLTQLYQMLKKDEYCYHTDIANHDKKMAVYRSFLVKHGIAIEGDVYKIAS